MTVILFIVILAVLVFVHEAGHFMAAKAFGIRVDEFSIGFPPRIFSRQYGETTYAIGAIPFGGFVKIFGENPDDAGNPSPRSLANAAKWKQAVVFLAGIAMNFFFAWILIAVSFNIGLITSIDGQYAGAAQNPFTLVLSVEQNSPAERAGIAGGDEILSISSGKATVAHPEPSDIQNIIAGANGAVEIAYRRGGTTDTVSVTPGATAGSKKAIGVALALAGTVKFGFFGSMWQAGKLVAIESWNIAGSLVHLVANIFKVGALDGVAGPVGIASMVGQAESVGLSYLLGFVALISINLAVLNLVPLPALDGGRVFILAIEAVVRRKIQPSLVVWINFAGFALIILLMAVVTYHDIAAFVH
ncbi:MAG: site-2 protease family protein [Patescibacteria group bacterium]|nr:M50 family metallopeptidase [Patescibacteria group bacterium]MDE1946024.1 site-2 protease family protein [Patescibacteria group bacterium]